MRFTLTIFLLFILFSCNKNTNKTKNLENTEQAITLDNLLGNNQDSLYINIIPANFCFPCYPSVNLIANKYYYNAINKNKIIFIFPYLRKIKQKDFFEKNFGFKQDDIRIYFNDILYNQIKKQYNMSQFPCLLVKKGDSISIYNYPRLPNTKLYSAFDIDFLKQKSQ